MKQPIETPPRDQERPSASPLRLSTEEKAALERIQAESKPRQGPMILGFPI